jgi:trimethylamine-N-oxide reductase (cytochrome c)
MSVKRTTTHLKALSLLSETGAGGNTAAIDVHNGRIIRIRPFKYNCKDTHDKLIPTNIEVNGKVLQSSMKTLLPPHSMAYKKRVYSPNRIPYPVKRVDWDPSGERNPQNRGKSGYKRISWDEALELISAEIKRVVAEYGPEAILAQADGHGETSIVHPSHACNTLLLKHLGGYTLQTRNPDSWEGWYWGSKHVWGMEPLGQEHPVNVWFDMAQNCELILFWGCDPETTTWGFGSQMISRVCYWMSEIGTKSIYVCPDLNYGAAVHADKWIPIKPNTDAALHLAVAYTWINEGTYDKDYVDTHTYGFDKFKEYVLGEEEGVPKTPNWASEITGVPSRIIKALARMWASKKTSFAHGNGGPYIRGSYSTEPARLETLNLAMQGLGKPGVHYIVVEHLDFSPPKSKFVNPMSAYRGFYALQQAADYHSKTVNDVLESWNPQGRAVPYINKPTNNTISSFRPKQFIPKNLIHDAILNPPISWYGTTLWSEPVEDQFVKYTYPAEGCSEIHMIWTDTPCWITCWNDSNSYMRALQSSKIDFILAQHPWLENDCLFADIILPVNTKFEERDICLEREQFIGVILEEKCIESLGESFSDYEVVCKIAEKMGLLDKVTEGKSVDEWIRFAYDNSGAADLLSFEDFEKDECFMVPTDPDWKPSTHTKLLDFYNDPERYPLKTPSGKIEFCSQSLSKYFPSDKERPPVPHWIPYGETHQESLLHTRSNKYPLLCMSNHGRWRVHANLDDVTWFHEIETCKVKGADGYLYEPVWMHPTTARERGIKNGDIVNIFNERGGVLCGAYVTERLIPGVVYVDHGSRHDPIVSAELDRGGAINTITPHNTTSKNCTGMVVSGFLVEAKKAEMDDLRRKYPEAFNRTYDPAAGLKFERALHND